MEHAHITPDIKDFESTGVYFLNLHISQAFLKNFAQHLAKFFGMTSSEGE